MISLARALHVLGIVWWVGGVAMVTATILPALHAAALPEQERLVMFKRIHRRFVWQARGAVLLVGASGAYLLTYLGGFARLAPSIGWWVDLMLVVWGLFALILFVLEPLGLMHKTGIAHRPRVFLLFHVFLLSLALASIAAGVIGAHGGFY